MNLSQTDRTRRRCPRPPPSFFPPKSKGIYTKIGSQLLSNKSGR